MPYIKKSDRFKFNNAKMIGLDCKDLIHLANEIYLVCQGFADSRITYTDESFRLGDLCDNNGELNYLITNICLGYLGKEGMISYQKIDDIFRALEIVIFRCQETDKTKCLGTLRCAELEFYRRVAVNYEILKISENGDCF